MDIIVSTLKITRSDDPPGEMCIITSEPMLPRIRFTETEWLGDALEPTEITKARRQYVYELLRNEPGCVVAVTVVIDGETIEFRHEEAT